MAKYEPKTPAEAELRQFALTYPEATEEMPWGHCAIKVKGKMFLVLSWDDQEVFRVTVKLPLSRRFALTLPYASPTGYGLGKSGWITAEFQPGADIPLDIFEQWIDESYRAIAPKKLVARLDDPSRSKQAEVEEISPVAPPKKKPAARGKVAHKSKRISSSLRRKPRRS